ncbi:HlyD family type I secretion periplasmic adaptor subunit [Sphingomonas sp. ID0503]|uniref:HlyD family type I secretion periplasmic adaptor subunit n=1 Tax=Sphingomonas sp. ID0503 TaxID=3399691 RepID=UPI003AFB03CC
MSAHLEDLTTSFEPKSASRLLLWVIVGVFVILITFAAFTKINQTTRANGRVIPSSQLQVLSNLEGGIVSRILVRSGQKVPKGAPLVVLDKTLASADLGRGSVTRDALRARVIRLQAELSGTRPVWPADLTARVPDIVTGERRLYASRIEELNSLMGAASARAVAARQEAAASGISAETRAAASQSAAERAALIRPLVEKGIEPRLTLMQAENEARTAAGDAATARESVGRARAGVAEARAQAAQARADWLARAGQDLAEARANLAAQEQILAASEDKVRRTMITAPVRGTINRVLVSTPGAAVQPGAPIVELVPAEDRLIVEAQVRPNDIGFITPGQKATVKLTAYDYTLYGSLPGVVTSISPDATVNPQDGSSFYHIRVAVDRDAIVAPNGEKLPIGAGMVAEIDLIGQKRTILSYLLTPITRVTDMAFREK